MGLLLGGCGFIPKPGPIRSDQCRMLASLFIVKASGGLLCRKSRACPSALTLEVGDPQLGLTILKVCK